MRLYPHLLHPVSVTIYQTDTGATVYDDDAREPVNQVGRKMARSLPGQVRYVSSMERKVSGSYGYEDGESGDVTFRQKDLDVMSVRLVPGDRITGIGTMGHDVYITRLMPFGHYPEFGHTLLKAFFTDRQPAKHRSAA